MSPLPRILCIAGPTGSGKTGMALRLAGFLARHGRSAHIINADSRQVYRDFPIITAQPSPDEQKNFPHHLYGWLPSGNKISAGEWSRLAENAIGNALRQGCIPILVGGTGFYMKTLLDGISEIPPVPSALHMKIIGERESYGTAYMHRRLLSIDPEYASKIHPNDKQRIMRALEVWEATGCTFTWWHAQKTPSPAYEVLRLGVGMPLAELTPLLENRIHAMLEMGALKEAENAMHRCPDMNAPAWSGIGCMELGRHLRGEISLAECIAMWKANTRAYAKRQWTWFKADARITWLSPLEYARAEKIVTDFLSL